MGEPIDVLVQAVRVQPFEGVDDLRVDGAPPRRCRRLAVGHLLGEGVGEGVFRLGDEAGLIEQFGGLHVPQTAPRECPAGTSADGLQEGDRRPPRR